MTKTCDIDIVVQGSSVQRETKYNRNVEQVSMIKRELMTRQWMKKIFLFEKKLKKNDMLTKSHQLRKFRMK